MHQGGLNQAELPALPKECLLPNEWAFSEHLEQLGSAISDANVAPGSSRAVTDAHVAPDPWEA
jgi:hypothetical protein